MRIFAVDTSLAACSAALLEDENVLAHRFLPMERGHAEALGPMVAGIKEVHGFEALDRLAVTIGPGTFTGQRVGLAFMRGLRLALDLPLIGITSLAAMTAQARAELGITCAAALHDAKRDEVYFEMDACPMLLSLETVLTKLGSLRNSSTPIALAGSAAPRAFDILGEGFMLSRVRQPDALWVAKLGIEADVSNSPPKALYLRAPDARLPVAR